MITITELFNATHLVIISAGAIITLLIAAFAGKSKLPALIFSILVVLSAVVFAGMNASKDMLIFNELLKINPLSNAFAILAMLSVFITFFASYDYLEKLNINYGEYYSLLQFALLGMLIMIYANDLLTIFVGLETMSICFYILSGMMRKRMKSNESAMKYFLLGAFMTGFLLYGMSMIYGVSGTTNITKILSTFAGFKTPVFLVGVGLFLVGFFFKIGIFPFQMWIPDVYEGAPTVVSGMMAAAGKVSAVGVLVQIISILNFGDYRMLFSILATLTMLYGNIVALTQTNLKRLLAYSSIASAGYILVGLTAMDEFAARGVAFYLLAYVFMQLGAFIVVSVVEKSTEDNKDFTKVTFDDYKGLSKRNPFLAILMTIFLFSLAGIPPLAGFWGKYYIFYSAIRQNLLWLSIIAIILSVVSVYYYLKVIVFMWFHESTQENEAKEKINPFVMTSLLISLTGTLLFGFYPQLFFSFFGFIFK
ncbi:MAG: NADH-quinone oxidoreductase subunit N [Ignavibacteria bacterium]|nr:NADH-quinone oxidoreductase subunit N [Ignavibacteria bacterium]